MKTINRKKNKKIFKVIIGIIVILILFAAAYTFFFKLKSSVVDIKKPEDATILSPTNNLIHFAAMGDMMAHDTVMASAKTGNTYDFTKFFKNIRPNYQTADIIFCDQEGLSSGEEYGISGYPAFNAPVKYAADLKNGAGCNMVNLANNHMGDRGVSATNATISAWEALKPTFLTGANKSSADQEKVSIATVNGIRVAFLAFADYNNNADTPGYSVNNYNDEVLVRRLMTNARANADAVIVSMHWGIEDSSVISEDQRNAAELVSNLGADVIIGTGPHVLQPVHVVERPDGGQTVIWYSIGNMLSSQLTIQELIGGIAKFDIKKNNNGKISIENLEFTPTYMHYEWTAAQAAAENLLARKNLMIYILSEAAEPLSKSLFNTTIAEQRQYVVDTLGGEVVVK